MTVRWHDERDPAKPVAPGSDRRGECLEGPDGPVSSTDHRLAQSPGRAGSAIWRISARTSFSAWSSTCPAFEHSGRRGAFRSWLRTIVCSRTIDYWRAIDASTQASGGSGATAALQQIADPDSDLNRQWDEEHDRYVLHCLLDLVEEEFEPATLQAFRRLALDGASGAEAAQELGLSVAGRLHGEVACPAAHPPGGGRAHRLKQRDPVLTGRSQSARSPSASPSDGWYIGIV